MDNGFLANNLFIYIWKDIINLLIIDEIEFVKRILPNVSK